MISCYWEGNSLAHHGVQGQQWHVRRYQNEDGTLTEEGRRRYGVGDPREAGYASNQKQKPSWPGAPRDEKRSQYKDPNKRIDEYRKQLATNKGLRNSLNAKQKQIYDNLSVSEKKWLEKKMAKGKDFDRAWKEMALTSAVTGAATGLAIMYISPVTRPLMKAAGKNLLRHGKQLFRRVANTNAAQKGRQYMSRMMRRRAAYKNGAIPLKKSAYSVRDFVSGYLT